MTTLVDLTTPRATRDVVADIVSIDDRATRLSAVNSFLHSRKGQFERMAASMLRTYRVRDMSLTGDVANILAKTAYTIIEKMAGGWAPSNPSITFEVQVRMDSRAQVRSLLDHELPKLSGSVGAQRRYREAQKTVTELSHLLGRAPTPEEIITATNSRLRTARKDAAREGLLVNEADLVAPGAAIMSIDSENFHEPLVYDYQAGDGMSALMDLMTSRELVRSVVAACSEQSEELGVVARVWLATVLDSNTDPTHRSVRAQMAAYAGVRSARIPGLLKQVIEVARRIVLDQMRDEA